MHRADLYQKCNRGSHSSDTSSAYSGSDTMTSIHSSTMDPDEIIDLSGLVESVVDSDEEDLAESMDVRNDLNLRKTLFFIIPLSLAESSHPGHCTRMSGEGSNGPE